MGYCILSKHSFYPKSNKMKQSIRTLLVCLIVLTTLSTTAQKNKPLLFAQLPSKILISTAQLNQLFNTNIGNTVAVINEANINIKGTVKIKQTKFNSLQSIAFTLVDYNNIVLSFSKRMIAQNTSKFTGHVFSNQYHDGFELQQIDSNTYQLVKYNTAIMLPTCSHK
jgi:hypothetical protein